MAEYIVFNTTTGEITRTGRVPDDMINLQAGAGETAITGVANDLTDYIANPGTTNDVTAKALLSTVATWDQTTITADGVDEAILSTLPAAGSFEIAVPENAAPIPGGAVSPPSLTFKATEPGTYVVTVKVSPYLDAVQSIIAT